MDNDGFSNDDISHSQSNRIGMPDRGGSTGAKAEVLSSEIIPERRRKYLSNNGANDDAAPYAKVIDGSDA